MNSERSIQLTRSTLIVILLTLGSLIMIMPFYWTLITAIKTPSETATYPIIWIPSVVTFKWFAQAWNAKFPIYYMNSGIVAICVVLSNVFTSALAGFIFAKYSFPLKNALFSVVLGTMMVPFIITVIPAYYIVAVWMGIKDTLLAMIVPALISPFGIFLMRQFASTIPDELLDAARIDGATDFRTFWQIVIPLSVPALSALAIFHFIWIWNDFLWPLLVTDSDRSRTLPIGVAMFALPRWSQTNLIVASSVLVLLPMVIIYFIFQRAFVRGIVLTGMKY